MMTTLPPELFIEVVRNLHNAVYFPDPPTRRALLSLCLTSHYLHELAVPLLYSSIRIDLPGACEELSRSPYVSQHLRSISVGYHKTWDPRFLEHIPVLCSLLDNARQNLRTIILDLSLRWVWPEEDPRDVKQFLRRALENIPNIETAVSCQDELFLHREDETGTSFQVTWSQWTSLRRVSFYNRSFDTNLADICLSLPSLEIVINHNADHQRHLVGLTRIVTSTNVSGLRLQIVYICDYPHVLERIDLRPIHQLASQNANLRIVPTPLQYTGDINESQTWVRELAETGKLWDLRPE